MIILGNDTQHFEDEIFTMQELDGGRARRNNVLEYG
jgi:hypothetical protein